MEVPSRFSVASLFLLFLPTLLPSGPIFLHVVGLGVGVNYGQIADNLPPPSQVVVLLQSLNINKVKLYDADPRVLTAFQNTNVEFTVGIGNEDVANMMDPSKARAWLQQHIQPYLSQTRITCLTVGNEVLSGNNTALMSNLLPAMRTIHRALVALGLDKQVNVTTAHSVSVLKTSYPPSSGSFGQDLARYIQPLLRFHSQSKTPFLVNVYPYFAYKGDPGNVPLDYVLFRPNSGVTDPNTNLHYDNMLFAQIDSVYSAIRAMGHTDVDVRVSETGWPSKGDPEEVGATPQNAATYNGNLMKRVATSHGTPMNPSLAVDVYVFALFNENLKPGPASERNYGLFYPDGTPVYDVGVQRYLPSYAYAYAYASLSVKFGVSSLLVILLSIATSLLYA